MKSFRILNGKAYVVELPEGAHSPSVCYYSPVLWVYPKDRADDESKLHVSLPASTWEIVGRLSEVTEEQAATLVGRGTDSQGNEDGYEDYEGMIHGVRTALESLHSAIRASGWYLENPHGKSLNQHCVTASEPGDLAYLSREWRKAQSRTLPIERTLILEKI